MATYTLSMSNSWCSGTYSVTHSISGRNATISVTLRLWRNDGGNSYNYDASNNFYINISGNIRRFTIQSITGSAVSVSHSATFTTDNSGNLTVSVEVGGSIPGSTFSITGNNRTSYRVTGASPASWTVSYNANGGSGAPSAQSKIYNQTLILSSVEPTRPGYIFMGWGTSSTATVATYQPGDSYTTNAAITLYAVWIVADLINFSFDAVNYTVKSDTYGKVTTSTLDAATIPFDVNSTSDNYNLNFYYKVYDYTRTIVSQVYGPFTAKDIADGGGDSVAFSIPLTTAQILSSLQNYDGTDKTLFYVDVCTGSNSFSEETTSIQTMPLTLVNFAHITYDPSKCAGYRDVDGGTQIDYYISYPPCYEMSKMTIDYSMGPIQIGTSNVSVSNSNSADSNIYVNQNYLPSTASEIVKIVTTDNISTCTLMFRINSVGNEGIEIFKTYSGVNGPCVCTEFIETDGFVGFQKGGRVYAGEFVEQDGVVMIGDTTYFGELIEE